MTATATQTQTPAERITPGIGHQLVNVVHPDGRVLRQVRWYGTEEAARAYAELQVTHDSNPRHAELRAICAQSLADRKK